MDASLVLTKKDGQRKVFPLGTGVTVIGRRPDCDLRIPLMDVSRRHCQLDCHGNIFSLRDLGSFNGTFVNGEKIEETRLISGDQVQIGPVTFVFEIAAAASAPPQTPQPAAPTADDGLPQKVVKEISDDEFFADIGPIEDAKSGSATEFPTES